ncbi:hypothetical protein ElyMa_000860000 [Elysia marginata]|uniref:Uncharacterized protein n=1 Tax=Elysia marginata TaxID=1093978 RepID=A0AAV4H3B8_9GAST|nr:hypothetical protein ElyMa_000860000 [Elysia marginata]
MNFVQHHRIVDSLPTHQMQSFLQLLAPKTMFSSCTPDSPVVSDHWLEFGAIVLSTVNQAAKFGGLGQISDKYEVSWSPCSLTLYILDKTEIGSCRAYTNCVVVGS